jgi:signal transduction histidine kinase
VRRGWSVRARVMLSAALWAVGFFGLSSIVVTYSPVAFRTLSSVHRHAQSAWFVAVVCIIVGFVLVRGAIAPLVGIRSRLSDVRRGVEQRLRGSYPSEVQPLVDDLNALLQHRDETIRRAIATAGDLAHGLKTPLAILAREADRAEAAGNVDLATTIGDQIDRMRRQIDHHLARARAAASGATSGARCSVAGSSAASRARSTGSMANAASRSASRSRRITSSADSAKTSTRCSATCSTTPANGRAPASSSPHRSTPR